jgi:hypothetical protein
MWHSRIVAVLVTAGMSSSALVGPVSVGQAQVQGLDDLHASRGSRAGCPGGYVEGLGCSSQRSPAGPGIQDSDQGWQRDWQDFGAGDPGLSVIYGNEGGPYLGGRPPPHPPGFGPPRFSPPFRE